MVDYLMNFVKTGDPNGEGLPEWELWDADEQNLLELGEEVRMIEDPYKDIYVILDKYQE
jgi:para-nitrobenzyl esterase